MAIFLYFALGLLLGLVWYALAPKWHALGATADLLLGVLGAWTGSFLASFFDPEFRVFPVSPIGVSLAMAFAVCFLFSGWWVARVPEDA